MACYTMGYEAGWGRTASSSLAQRYGSKVGADTMHKAAPGVFRRVGVGARLTLEFWL